MHEYKNAIDWEMCKEGCMDLDKLNKQLVNAFTN